MFLQGANYLFSLLSTRNLTWFHQGVLKERVLKFVHRWIQASHHLYRDRTKQQGGDYLLFRFERADANRTGRYFAVRGSRAVKCTGRLAALPPPSLSLFAFSPIDVHARWKYAECFKKLDQTSGAL